MRSLSAVCEKYHKGRRVQLEHPPGLIGSKPVLSPFQTLSKPFPSPFQALSKPPAGDPHLGKTG